MTILLLLSGCVGSVHEGAIAFGFGPVMSAVWLVDASNAQGLWVTNVTYACDKWQAAFAAKTAFDTALEAATDPDTFCVDMMEPTRAYVSAMDALQHAGAHVLYIMPREPFVATTYAFHTDVEGVLRRYSASPWASAMDGWDEDAREDDACGTSPTADAGVDAWMIAEGDLAVASVLEGESLDAAVDGELAAEEGPILADFTARWCELATEWDAT